MLSLLNVLVIPPGLSLGPKRHPPLIFPMTCPVLPALIFCGFLYFESQNHFFKKNRISYFRGRGEDDRSQVSPSPEWVRLGTQWQSHCSQDQKQPPPLCPRVQGQWPWIAETPVSWPRIFAQIFQSLKWQGRGKAFGFWRSLSNSTESTTFFEHLLCARGRNTMVSKMDTAPALTEPTIGRRGLGLTVINDLTEKQERYLWWEDNVFSEDWGCLSWLHMVSQNATQSWAQSKLFWKRKRTEEGKKGERKEERKERKEEGKYKDYSFWLGQCGQGTGAVRKCHTDTW